MTKQPKETTEETAQEKLLSMGEFTDGVKLLDSNLEILAKDVKGVLINWVERLENLGEIRIGVRDPEMVKKAGGFSERGATQDVYFPDPLGRTDVCEGIMIDTTQSIVESRRHIILDRRGLWYCRAQMFIDDEDGVVRGFPDWEMKQELPIVYSAFGYRAMYDLAVKIRGGWLPKTGNPNVDVNDRSTIDVNTYLK